MTVNVDNINLMIKAISEQANPIHMGDFVWRNAECGTTACLAGWANVLRQQMQGKLSRNNGYIGDYYVDFTDTDKASDWMGISRSSGLFFDYRADQLNDDDRKTAAIALLTKLRDNDGKANWSDVLDTTYEDGLKV